MRADLLRHQGVMFIESEVLDRAFAGVNYTYRQRLISAELDFTSGEADCSRLEFADDDNLIMSAVHTGGKRDNSGEIYYEPWKVYIGYYDQEKEDMTQMVGYPQMEVPTFPEDGPQTISVRLFSASALMKKNTTPNGSVDHWIIDKPDSAFMTSMATLAETYKCTLAISDRMIEIIKILDKGIYDREIMGLHFTPTLSGISKSIVGDREHNPAEIAHEWNRSTVGVTDPVVLESDYAYLYRVMSRITRALESGIIPATGSLPTAIEASNYSEGQAEAFRSGLSGQTVTGNYVPATTEGYFKDTLVGLVSKSDVRVVWGIQGSEFIIMLAHEFIEKYGFPGIPVLQYREGNGLIRSASMSLVESETQGKWASFVKLFTQRDEEETVETEKPIPDTYAGVISPKESSLGSYGADKYIRLLIPPINAPATAEMDITELKRALESKLTGEIVSYGIPKLVDGQLVALTGLGKGASSEAQSGTTDDQDLAFYSRIYLIKSVTHKMDAQGSYSMTMKVAGCTIDGSDDTETLKSLLALLTSGVSSGSAEGWMARLFGWFSK